MKHIRDHGLPISNVFILQPKGTPQKATAVAAVLLLVAYHKKKQRVSATDGGVSIQRPLPTLNRRVFENLESKCECARTGIDITHPCLETRAAVCVSACCERVLQQLTLQFGHPPYPTTRAVSCRRWCRRLLFSNTFRSGVPKELWANRGRIQRSKHHQQLHAAQPLR